MRQESSCTQTINFHSRKAKQLRGGEKDARWLLLASRLDHWGQERGGFQALGKLKANFFIVHSTEYNAAWQDANGPAQGKVFQINWQVKAFLHCRLSTLWKEAKTRTKKQNHQGGAWVRWECNGDAAILCPVTAQATWLQQGRGAQATQDSFRTC